MFSQGAFQIDQNATPEQIARQRKAIADMMPQYGKAQYFGEGLAQLFHGIGSGISERKLDKTESAGIQTANDQFSRLFGGPPAQPSGPLSVLGMDPGYGGTSSGTRAPAMPMDPNSPEAIGSDAMAAIGKQSFTPGDKESFIQAMMPHAIKVSQETGLDPRIVIAQAAQETGWGKSAPGNNFFGIKSHGKGGGNTFATNEVVDGKTVRINDSFRGYDSMGDSAMGYASFLKENPRYGKMLAAGDLEGQIAALGESGYATDPNYASSVRNIATGIGLPSGAAPAAPSAPGVPINELYMALQNPWMSQEQKSLVTTMIAEQQQASDPMRQIELAQAQLNLEQDQQGGGAADMPSDVQALQYRAQAAGLQPGTPEYQSFMLNGGGDPAAYRALEMQALASGYQKGTPEFEQFMATRGAGVTEAAKVNAGNIAETQTGGAAAAAIAQGTIQGQTAGNAQAQLSSNLAQADQAVSLIDSIIADPALPGITGMLQGRMPPITQGGTDLGVKIDQLQGKAFLQAFDSLKGGGAISEREGQAATAAMARLSRAQSTEAYVAALDEIKGIMQLGAERARAKAGGVAPAADPVASPGAPAGAPQPGMTEDGYQFQGGDPADAANWVKVQ